MPFAIDALAAVIVRERRAAAVIFSTTLFDVMPLCVALMLVEPTALPVTNPAVLMLATVVLDELQVTELVRFCVLPSVNVPVAVN